MPGLLCSGLQQGDSDVAAHSQSLPVHKRCLSKKAHGTAVATVPSSGNCWNLHRKVKLITSTSPSLYFYSIKKNQILISILNWAYQSQMSQMETNKIQVQAFIIRMRSCLFFLQNKAPPQNFHLPLLEGRAVCESPVMVLGTFRCCFLQNLNCTFGPFWGLLSHPILLANTFFISLLKNAFTSYFTSYLSFLTLYNICFSGKAALLVQTMFRALKQMFYSQINASVCSCVA